MSEAGICDAYGQELSILIQKKGLICKSFPTELQLTKIYYIIQIGKKDGGMGENGRRSGNAMKGHDMGAERLLLQNMISE